jgi:hypothetical protein
VLIEKIGNAHTPPPFGASDVIALGSLSRALDQLVFGHSEVQLLCRMATALATAQQIPIEEDAGLVVQVLGYDEPLIPLRYFAHLLGRPVEALTPESAEEAAIQAEHFDAKVPPDLHAYYDAVHLRADTVIGLLQRQELVARGHTADGHLVQIAHSIWSHDEYYVHPPTGDIYEASTRAMTRRWSGVVLEPPAASSVKPLFHVEPTEHDGIRSAATENRARAPKHTKAATKRKMESPHRKTARHASIEKAVAELWPDGVPTTMLLKTRDEMIAARQRRNKTLVASSKTIRRFLNNDGPIRS